MSVYLGEIDKLVHSWNMELFRRRRWTLISAKEVTFVYEMPMDKNHQICLTIEQFEPLSRIISHTVWPVKSCQMPIKVAQKWFH